VQRYVGIAQVLLTSFSAIAVTLMAILRLPSLRRNPAGWGGRAYPLLIAACAIQFLSSAPLGMAYDNVRQYLWPLVPLQTSSRLVIPALYLQVFYFNERRFLPFVCLWKTCLLLLYGGGIAGLVWSLAGVLSGEHARMEGLAPLVVSLFVAAGGLTAALLLVAKRVGEDLEQATSQRAWSIGISVALAAGILAVHLWETFWLDLLVSVLPPAFILVVTYYVERLSFFDVLLKQASFAFLTLLITTLYFLLMPGWMRHQGLFAWSVSLWPILLVYPLFHRRLSAWIDRSWLGRRYSPAEAGKYFLDGLQGIVHEGELVATAESRLSEIFQAPASIVVDPDHPHRQNRGFGGMTAPLRQHGHVAGCIVISPRQGGSRFLSEDQTLLSALAESTSFLLENIRLREIRIEQETREQELMLSANRSQLKALRAQINPHFLFNALNTIAGLIPGQPDRADRTIERLADVFRYTLRRAEREWVRLDEEIEAVRAYLDVEQARFDDSLTVHIEISEEARDARIPSMIVQTLVENAVKHGVGAICGPGLIEIESVIRGTSLMIQVRDNGPGFDEEAIQRADQTDSHYGLRNTRDRLFGYCGADGRLRIARDQARCLTVVEIEVPAEIGMRFEGTAGDEGGGYG